MTKPVKVDDLRVACPQNMVHAVALVLDGEYDMPVENVSRVLDIGANVGAFALWATRRWPGCRVTAYEPQAVCREACQNSAEINGLKDQITCIEAAVVGTPRVDGHVRLYLGPHNLGEASTVGRWHKDDARSVEVPAISVGDLPACDILKVDTEGAELEIIRPYLLLHRPAGVAYEYHRRIDRDELEMLMADAGYELVGGTFYTVETGVQRWVRGPRS